MAKLTHDDPANDALTGPHGTARRTVKLASGGRLVFELVDVNLLQVSATDRTFLFDLVDRLEAFDTATKTGQTPSPSLAV